LDRSGERDAYEFEEATVTTPINSAMFINALNV
jgi:hypothetical protein